LTQEFRNSSAAFRLFYFSFIIVGFLFFAYLMRDIPLDRFRDILLFIALIIVADTAQISLPRGGASIAPMPSQDVGQETSFETT
jgi:hypothetical protein